MLGKTGTTSDFRDALLVGSTYEPEGIVAVVRIGFDDNHFLGPTETGGGVALPVFRGIVLGVSREKIAMHVPQFRLKWDRGLPLA
jgi:membrane carboxypeptidase/penicillin-binding protein